MKTHFNHAIFPTVKFDLHKFSIYIEKVLFLYIMYNIIFTTLIHIGENESEYDC